MELDFEQIVSSYYESLYRFALTLARNEPDACDLTQDTFYTFAAEGHQLRDKSKIKSWLFTALHRKFLGARRHDTRFPHFEVSSVDRDLPTTSPTMVDEMDSTTVWQAMMQLEENFRAPLVLLYLEDHSYREIAEALEIPIGTVMSRVSRGKTLLREQLTQTSALKIISLEQKQFKKNSP